MKTNEIKNDNYRMMHFLQNRNRFSEQATCNSISVRKGFFLFDLRPFLALIFITLLLFCFHLSALSQSLVKKWSSPVEFKTPESVLYHAEQEVIFVSNIGELRDAKTPDGFISLLTPEGEIENLHWFKGLYDPKGMAIFESILYVADINEVIAININNARIEKKYSVPKAKFLNDVAVGNNGSVFISDMHDQSIYQIDKEEISLWLKDPRLEQVNGLWVENGKLYAGNRSVWEIDIKTKEMKELFGGTGGVDGLEKIGENAFIFSNWSGRIFYYLDDEMAKMLDTSEINLNTADIDYVPELKMVLVPTFFGNSVEAYIFIP
jgi:hypothetical protein